MNTMDYSYIPTTKGSNQNQGFSALLGFFFLTVGFLLGGCWYYYAGFMTWSTCNPNHWSWPRTEGIVLDSGTYYDGTFIRPGGWYIWCQYTYNTNGHKYTQTVSESKNSLDFDVTKYRWNKTSNRPLEPGKKVFVRYNPKRPEEAIWYRGFDPWYTNFSLVASVTSLSFGGFCMLYAFGAFDRSSR